MMPERPRAAATGTRFDPNAAKAAAAARKRADTGPAFSISLKAILIAAFVVLVPLVVVLFKLGPAKAAEQWREVKPQMEGWTEDVVLKVCRDEEPGAVYDMFHRAPSMKATIVDEPVMMLTMPDEIHVDGFSSEGYFKGTYDVKKKSFVIDINVMQNSRTRHVESHVDDKGYPVIDSKK